MARTSCESAVSSAVLASPPGFRAVVGQKVEIEVYGTKVSGLVVRAGERSVVIDVENMVGFTTMRLGVQAVVTFGAADGAARVKATVGRAKDGISLQFTGPVQMVNRRAHPRAEINVPVDLVWSVDGRLGVVASGESVDLSVGGAKLRIGAGQQSPREQGPLLATLHVKNCTLTVPARVLAVNGRIIRLQFVGLSSAEESLINSMVLHHLVHNSGSSGM